MITLTLPAGDRGGIRTFDKRLPMPKTFEDPDFTLVHAFVENREHEAFNRLVLRYQDRVFSFCFRFFGNDEDAMDCSQEIFIKIYKNLDGFRFASRFSSWIYRIMLNTCNEMARSKAFRQRIRTISRDNSPGRDPISPVRDNNYSTDPEHMLFIKQVQVAFQESLDTLKPVQKSLVIMRDLEGRSYEEISGITGLKTGTLKSKLARARYKMSEQLKDYRNEM
jgi:RNA polymerase sigma-70 factor (ECF subfamily)